MGVFSHVQFSLCCVLFFGVFLSHADTTSQNDTVSTVCPQTKNPSLCRQLLKPVRKLNAIKMADHMLHLAHTSAVECRRRAQQLEAEETANLKLKKRYSECSESIDSSVNAIEFGKQYLALGGYIVVTVQVIGATNDVDQCLDTFNQPPPEPSSLPRNVKNLRDICDIASYVAHTLARDDY